MMRNKLATAGLMVYSWLSIKIGIILMIISLFGNTKKLFETIRDFFFTKHNAVCPIYSGLFSNINMIIGITGVILIASGIFILCVPVSLINSKKVFSMQKTGFE